MAFNENSKPSDFANLGANTQAQAQPAAASFAPTGANTASATAALNGQPVTANLGAQTEANVGGYKPRGLLGNRLQQRAMGRFAYGQIAIAFAEALVKIAEKEPDLHYDGKRWKLQVFDGAQNNTAISAVIMILDVEDYVAYYPIFLEATCGDLVDRQLNERGVGQFNLPTIPEELWSTDRYLSDSLGRYIKGLYPNKKLIEVAGIFVPRELEVTNTEHLRMVLYYATEAIETTLYSINPNSDTITLIDKKANEVISQSIRFSNDGQVADVVGLPMRSDIEVTLKVTENNQQAVNNGALNSEVLTMARGYIGLTYTGAPVINPQMMYGFAPGQVMPAPYKASFIINSLDNQTSGATLETQLLAISSTMSLVMNNNLWAEALKPNYALASHDRRDIGALTLNVNEPGMPLCITNTKTDSSFNLPTFLAKFVSSDLQYQIDVREVGELTHVQRVFIDMVNELNPDPEQNRIAYEAVVNAANRLTGGNFSKYWNNQEPIVYYDNNRIELGYYLNEKGEMRDLHEIDFLYFGNCIDDEGAASREFMDSFNPAFGSIPYRFYKRKRLYETYLPNHKITGFAQRLTFNVNFLVALGKAIHDAVGGFRLETANMSQTIERGYRNNLLGLTANQAAMFIQQGYGMGYGYNNQGNLGQRTFRGNQVYSLHGNINYNGIY